jgi:hypothetical protein
MAAMHQCVFAEHVVDRTAQGFAAIQDEQEPVALIETRGSWMRMADAFVALPRSHGRAPFQACRDDVVCTDVR